MRQIVLLVLLLFTQTAYSQSDTLLIEQHLMKLTKTELPRNHKNIMTLNNAARYIYDEFSKYADTTYYQPYEVYGKTYKNVICVFDQAQTETIVIGAHYDVCGDQEGADDNASGVAGLLELARLLKGKNLNNRIEIVAYTLEEPPYFRSEYMGSAIHAKSLKDNNVNVYGMACLEMIGYYDDAKKSQDYPLGFLKLFYGSRGNYITLVNKMKKGKFSRKFTGKFKKQKLIRTKKFNAPKSLTGIDWSDHLNYWKLGYSALMITDTSFYRNKNYHEDGDKLETLNIPKIAEVIDSVLLSLTQI